MNKVQTLIDYAQKYYTGIPTGITDEEYDKLFFEVVKEDPSFNIFEHVKLEPGIRVNHKYPFQPQDFKEQFHSIEEFFKMLENYNEEYFLTYKYDGSSIRCYYKDGILTDIVTRADECSGIRQLGKLKNHVPNIVDKSVICIDFEALVSKEDYGEDSRSKANGLINSKYMQDEVDKYLKMMPFKVTSSKTNNYLESMRLVFNDDEFIIIDNKEILTYQNRFVPIGDKNYPIDGFVVYFTDRLNHQIYKFYSDSDTVTTVTDIEWNFKDNLSFTPKIIFKPVRIQGRNIGRATSNGYQRLSSIKAGIGAEVKIALVNSTIPQVVQVLKPSEDYNIPKSCPSCGSPMTIINDKVRCTNKYCTMIYKTLVGNYLRAFLGKELSSKYLSNKVIDNREKFIEFLNDLREEGLEKDIHKIGFFISWSVPLERFKKQGELEQSIDSIIEDLINNNKSLRDYNLGGLSWNQQKVFETFIDVLDEIINLIYKV